MAANLVSLVTEFLTPDMIGRIASALGIDRSKTLAGIGAAVPGLLAGLSGVATQPGGAQKLVDAVRQQSGTLGNLTSAMGGGGQSSLIEKGSQMLGSLLGGNQTALADAVGKFAGLGQGASGSLLGMLGPIVMGTIAQQQGSSPLNAGSITNLLASQKANIAAALPAGFGKLLGGTGLLDSLGGSAQTAVAAASQTARAATSAAQAVSQRAPGAGASASSWFYWLIPILAVAALLVYLLARPTEQVVQQGATMMQSLTVGGLDIGKQVTDSVGNLRSTLAGITDVSSAEAALPKLRQVTAQIDKVDSVIGQLSPEQRETVAGLLSPAMPTINQLFDKVLAIPGVSEVLKPTVDALKTKLAALAA
jgi:hypothetical protein